jgi:phosphonate degradation associated HDIG domain protein
MTDTDGFIDQVFGVLTEKGADHYGESGVNQLQHALQAAAQAERAGAGDAMIAAALLHDIGHLIDADADAARLRGEDRRHEDLGADYLAPVFGPDVTEPIRLHVPAKRYLVARKDAYGDRLSPASVHSLDMQGGAFDAAEAEAFERLPYFEDAVRLRVWDEGAKDADAETPPLEHYRETLIRAAGR